MTPSEATVLPAPAAPPGAVPAARGPSPLVHRFGGTERLLHWIHAAGFLTMLGSGLLLYLPALSDTLGGRPVAKALHLAAAAVWMTAIALVVLLGDRRALARTRAEVERLTADDRAWLRRRPAPQGRFNAGQKLHTVVQAAFAVLFVVSGLLLWAGERVNELRLPGTIVVHDGAMYAAVLLLLGHLWLALVWPPTRHALRGIVRGTVRADWAARHHPAWASSARPVSSAPHPSRAALGVAIALLAAGALVTAFVVHDSTQDIAGESVSIAPAAAVPEPATDAAAAAPPSAAPEIPPPAAGTPPLELAGEAQQLQTQGALNAAIERYRLALRELPDRPDVRTAYGLALVDAGNLEEGLAQLRRAARFRPAFPPAQEVLDAVLEREAG